MKFYVEDCLCEVGGGDYELPIGFEGLDISATATFSLYHNDEEEIAELYEVTFYDEEGDEIDDEEAYAVGINHQELTAFLENAILEYVDRVA